MTIPQARLGDHLIGAGQPCYLIAEVGTTCGGDTDKALRLSEAAAAAGVDAVKFQVIDPAQVSDADATYPVQVEGRTVHLNMREMFERLQFTPAQWRALAAAAAGRGLHFLATVDYPAGVDLLEELGVAAHKIGAWDITYRQLLERIGRTGKPMFADLGPATLEELDTAVRWYRDAGGSAVLFMHDFHTQDDREMNLRAIDFLNRHLPWPAGWSSPARDDDLDVAALAVGAAYIEKRLILSRRDWVFHAHESLEPDEFAVWVARIRHVERALGVAAVRPSARDLELSREYYRSLFTTRALPAGHALAATDLEARRPGGGIPTTRHAELVGRRLRRDLPAETLLAQEDLL